MQLASALAAYHRFGRNNPATNGQCRQDKETFTSTPLPCGHAIYKFYITFVKYLSNSTEVVFDKSLIRVLVEFGKNLVHRIKHLERPKNDRFFDF